MKCYIHYKSLVDAMLYEVDVAANILLETQQRFGKTYHLIDT